MPQFQLKYCVLILGISLLSSFISAKIITFYTFDHILDAYSEISPANVDSPTPESKDALIEHLQLYEQNRVTPILVVLAILTSFITLLFGIVFSHQLAGPIYRLILYFQQKRWYREPLTLRKNDELQFLVAHINLLRNMRKDAFHQILAHCNDIKPSLSEDEWLLINQLLERMTPK